MASEWHDARFAQLCEHSAFGPRFAGELYAPDGNVATLRTTDISADGRIEYETMPLARLDLSRLQQHTLRPKDLVITRSGRIGTAALFNGFRLPVLPGAFLIRFRLKTDVAEPLFYRYFFNSRAGQELLTSVATGSVQQNLNITSVHGLEVPVPPLADQRAIAHILGTLDDKIELNRRMNETLEAIARAIFKSWFVDFDPVRAKASGEAPESICQRLGLTPDLLALFPDRLVDSELGDGSTSLTTGIPEGWGIGAFHSCCERIESGGTPSRSIAEYWNGSIPWLTSGEVRDVIVLDTKEKITEAGLNASSAKIWPIGTTVVAMYGATAGQVCLLAEAMTANQACCALIPKPEFISFVFLTARASISQLSDKASGSAQQNLNKSLVANHQLILPTLKIAEAFERIVSCLIDKWISNQRGSESLAALRDALLPKLLSGELRVPDAEKALEA